MLDHLRSATQAAHVGLEAALRLLDPPLSRDRFARALAGFEIFHGLWEPKVEAMVDDPDLLAPRRKLALIAHDLEALGWTQDDAAAFDLDFLHDASTAWGSLYVMEGSTLGGQLISKHLRTTDWAPEDGLTYFNPYGRRTAAMWAQFRAALEARAPHLDAGAVTEGACATFRALQHGLTAGDGARV